MHSADCNSTYKRFNPRIDSARGGILMLQKIASGLLLLTLTISINARTGIDPTQENNGLSSLWNIAPPAPKITEADRLAELAARRAEVMKRVGPKGMLIL